MPTSSSPEQLAKACLQRGNSLGAVRVVQEARWPNESMRLQYLAFHLTAVGRCREPPQAFNQARGPPHPLPPPSQEELDAIQAVPLEGAEQFVLRAAEEHQIVILNEAHHQPEHRLFGARLISRL